MADISQRPRRPTGLLQMTFLSSSHLCYCVILYCMFTLCTSEVLQTSDGESVSESVANYGSRSSSESTPKAIVDCGFPEASIFVHQGRFFLVNRTTTLGSIAELRCFNSGGLGGMPPAGGGRSHRVQIHCQPNGTWSEVDFAACLSHGYGPLRAFNINTHQETGGSGGASSSSSSGRSLSSRLNAILWGIILGSLSCLLVFIILLLYRGKIYPDSSNNGCTGGARVRQADLESGGHGRGFIPPPHLGRVGGDAYHMTGGSHTCGQHSPSKSWLGGLFQKKNKTNCQNGSQSKCKGDFCSPGSSPGPGHVHNNGESPSSDVTTTTLENIYEEISSKRIYQASHHRTTSSNIYSLPIYSDGEVPRPSSAAPTAGPASGMSPNNNNVPTEAESKVSKSEQVVVQNLYAKVDLVRKKHDRLLKATSAPSGSGPTGGTPESDIRLPTQGSQSNTTSQANSDSQSEQIKTPKNSPNSSQNTPKMASEVIDEDHFPYENLADYQSLQSPATTACNMAANRSNDETPLAQEDADKQPGHRFFYFGMK